MKKVMMGNHAVSYGAALCRVQVIAAYPITPQTQIVEKLSEMCGSGFLKSNFIKVESEHSALAAVMGASAAGARAFTATSAQGLALMHEIIHWVAGARLPIVMVNVNRAMAPPWSVWTDQNDSLSQRDTGWMQIYCESNQEVIDTVILAYKIAEKVQMPCMVILDAFVLSHTSEIVDIPKQRNVDLYLPPYKPKMKLDINNPKAFGALVTPEYYMEFRYKMQKAMDKAIDVAASAHADFAKTFGRRYDVIEEYMTKDAETVIVTSGTITSTARVVIDELREKGEKIGLLKMRFFRPFPKEAVIKALTGKKKVIVLDRNISFGHHGIFFQEIKSVMYGKKDAPEISGVILGLGGRDVTPDVIKDAISEGKRNRTEDIVWIGVKK
ncbi:pyruvate ferredoxin oxidoreductase [Candidatus Woesearchaeota archaeon CG11_big_fil_rev_8_21_14_0_20_43_8]|nr:MAG: pyruvate ferredoxin oxidoreductase [Candidatus Woesearchaeota archaeon CG11_big_fil_rev_8_21_14_0_20_43_8]